jgi:hypothetical protein
MKTAAYPRLPTTRYCSGLALLLFPGVDPIRDQCVHRRKKLCDEDCTDVDFDFRRARPEWCGHKLALAVKLPADFNHRHGAAVAYS